MASPADKLRAAMREEEYAEDEGDESSTSSVYTDLFAEIREAVTSGDDEAGGVALKEFIHTCLEGEDDGPKGKGRDGIVIAFGKK